MRKVIAPVEQTAHQLVGWLVLVLGLGDKNLSADEIAGATAALLTLDRDGSGQLEREETLPKPPKRGEGGGRGPQGPPPQGHLEGRPPGPPPGGARR